MKHPIANFVFYIFIPCWLLLSGCSGKVQLGGKVTFSDDNSPLTVGEVCFETDTYLARGKLDEKGRYTLGSVSLRDGLPPGNYRVYVANAVKELGRTPTGIMMTEPVIDPKFSKGATSGLTVEVSKSTRNYDFSVDRYEKK